MQKKDITKGFASLECKKVFKKHKYFRDKSGKWELVDYEVVCPQCGSVVYPAGSAFKAPKTTDEKLWAKLIPLFKSGYQFDSDIGSPFEEQVLEKKNHPKLTKPEFRKPNRKRTKNA